MEGSTPAACTTGQLFQHLGLCGDISQRNLILQPLTPPARDVLALSAQTIFKKGEKDWIFQDGEMQRRSLKGEWGLLCILELSWVPGASCTSPLTARRAGTMSCPAQNSQTAATCSSLPEEIAWEDLKRKEEKKKKKEKEKPSMVIRMNCLELDNQKWVAKQCSGKMIQRERHGVWYLRRERCVCLAEIMLSYHGTASWAPGLLQRGNAAFCSVDYYFYYLLLYCCLMGSGTFRVWVCRGAHLEDASSAFCPWKCTNVFSPQLNRFPSFWKACQNHLAMKNH